MEQLEKALQQSAIQLAVEVEELDESKKKLRRFRFFQVIGIVLAVITVACFLAAMILTNKFYNDYMNISAAAPAADREASYIRALKISPGKTDAYLALLDLYNEDGIFSQEESEKFLGLYNRYQQKLSWKDDGYAEIHYTTAFLYLNGYEGTSTTKLRLALPFLNIAMDTISEDDPSYSTVSCYYKIGSYYKTYIWDAAASVREVTGQQMQELVRDIVITLTSFNDNVSGESLYNRLGFYVAVCNLLYDQRDTLAMTVKEDSVTVILDEIYSSLPDESQIQKEQSKLLLSDLIANEETYRDMIHRAFERSVPN